MHKLMLEVIIADCRKREKEGDGCKVTPPHATEHLEDAVMQLDTECQALRADKARLEGALRNAGNALKICYADSHLIRVEALTTPLAEVIKDIRKWSGSHHNEIRMALSSENAEPRERML